ncbi:putative transposase Ptta/En/Spm plant [Arabidopsis thaliana x Arabidopsis arenosa]|uniref:Putative transposase Ptta/En/Spm plant n=1 Tax=Arabidopsis thaliana x Arabidopsis arenosa TaxID=1240361 RepID=A0A8T2A5V9_9BRAS|nr:putative transposase Ptta/En/Spm plant [Arabidopsis thaliana x Arabidopsis arenosa]
MRNKSSEPSKVTRSKVWVAGHTHSDGRPVRPEFSETIVSEMGSGTISTSVRDDAVSQVLGKDKSGRIRGMSRGVTASKLAFLQARDSHVQKLKAQQAELINKINDLQNEVCGLSKRKKSDDVSISETSNANKVVTRCQLLDWCSMDDIVVGEGEFCSAEPMYKIDRIPLGLNAAAVIVNSVSKEDAYVWRPTTTIFSLGKAMGAKIAWPSDKIIFDSDNNSPTDNQTAGSSAPLDRIVIFDWNLEDMIVAEGQLISTDPKELANNIPLGPNVAIVKVHMVINKDAYLWRPTNEMILMGDTLNEFIAWPIQKIGYSNLTPRTASPKESSPAVKLLFPY